MDLFLIFVLPGLIKILLYYLKNWNIPNNECVMFQMVFNLKKSFFTIIAQFIIKQLLLNCVSLQLPLNIHYSSREKYLIHIKYEYNVWSVAWKKFMHYIREILFRYLSWYQFLIRIFLQWHLRLSTLVTWILVDRMHDVTMASAYVCPNIKAILTWVAVPSV